MFCVNCGNRLSDKVKFCGNCGAPADDFIHNGMNPIVKSTTAGDEELSEWAKIGKQYKLATELSKGKSPDAKEASRKFYKMLWGQKLVRALSYTTAAIIGFSWLIGVVSAPSGSKSGSTNYSDSSRPSEKFVTIDEGKFSYSLFAGADEDGKTKEAWLLELDGAQKVKIINAYIYGKDTSSSDSWRLLMGDNKPRIICEQVSKDAKQIVANMTKKIENATLVGDYSMFAGDKLYLKNCIIQ